MEAALDAGVDIIASDQYEALRQFMRENKDKSPLRVP